MFRRALRKTQISFLWRAVLVCMACVPLNWVSAAQYSETIEARVGQTELFSHRGVQRVSVGNHKLADVKFLPESSEVLFIAKEVGVTDLRIWLKSGKQVSYLIRIREEGASDVLAEVNGHLEGVQGVQARAVGNEVILEGRVVREADYGRLDLLVSKYPNVLNYVLKPELTFKSMVYLDVRVVEVKKSALKEIGIDWADNAAGPMYGALVDVKSNNLFRVKDPRVSFDGVLPLSTGSTSFFGLQTAINSTLKYLIQNGHAKMLAEPKLVCKSGGKAEFHVGGEVPIPVTNADGAITVTFKSFGIILKMNPIADADGYISTKMEVEVSTLDPTVEVLGIPGFLTRKTDTELNVKNGQTMVLSGLLSEEGTKDVDKVVGLGEIPILGELFKSRAFQEKQTDLVVFVTPSLIDPESEKNLEWLDKADRLVQQSKEDMRFDLMD